MPVPDFSPGEVLTADYNSALNYGPYLWGFGQRQIVVLS